MMSIQEAVKRVPEWNGRDLQIEELSGGITNHNYKVVVDGAGYVVRIPGADSQLLAIDRDIEYRNAVAAHKAGVAPRVIHRFEDENIMVQEFIPGTTMTVPTIQNEAAIRKAVRSLKRLHGAPLFSNSFNMFRTMDRYIGIIQEHNMQISPGYVEEGLAVARQIEAVLNKNPQPPVACHNDILPENFIDTPGQYVIIDFELSGNNDPFFDLGNMAAECDYDEDQVEVLCEAYCGRPDTHKTARIELYAMMSDIGWTGWTLIQHQISSIDFDFWEYANFRWERARAKIHSSRFSEWLKNAS